MNQTAAGLLVLHGVVCLALWLLQRQKSFSMERGVFPLVVCVPVWGLACAVLLRARAARGGENAMLLETLPAADGEPPESLPARQPMDAPGTVPLEEALLIDPVRERRRLILSVLTEDPVPYYALLQQARMNEDSEVVHYAATAMAQISKQADLALQQLEQRYAAAPDAANRAAYSAALQQYLDAGLVQGRAAQRQQQILVQLLQDQLEQTADYACGCQLARAQLALGDCAAAEKTLTALVQRCPQKETAWLLRLDCAARRRDGAAVQEVLRQLKTQQVYLRAAGRRAVRFWQPQSTKQGGAGNGPVF